MKYTIQNIIETGLKSPVDYLHLSGLADVVIIIIIIIIIMRRRRRRRRRRRKLKDSIAEKTK
jgi:Flp pilus assembly protein TadB